MAMDIDLDLRPFPADEVWWSDLDIGEFLEKANLPEDVLERVKQQFDDRHTPVGFFSKSAMIEINQTRSKHQVDFDVLGRCDALSNNHVIHGALEIYRVLPLLEGLDAAEKKQILSDVFRRLLDPEYSETTQNIIDPDLAESAFFADELKTADAISPSEQILNGVLERYDEYRQAPWKFLAPYTSIVGPSGIGKSYCIRQLAVQHGVFVIYINLRPPNSPGFPLRSTVKVPTPNRRGDDLQTDWFELLNFLLRLSRSTKALGITPAGLFTLMARPEHSDFGTEANALLQKKGLSDDAMETFLSNYRKRLLGSDQNPPPTSQAKHPSLPVIICFDEAKTLITPGNTPFESLRSAAQNLFNSLLPHETPFFILLLDTTSKMTNFSPPKRFDPIQQETAKKLLHPLWKIDSWGVFGDILPDPDGAPENVKGLLSFERPLWGALLRSGAKVDSVLMAEKRLARYMPESRGTRDLALLSMRVNFYIGQYIVAEDLVSTYFRFVVDITDDRSTLLSTQPREPLLAFVSSRILSDPETRLSVLRSWESSLATGTVNPGDVGEQIAVLILLFAFDEAADPRRQLPRPVSLASFWAALFGKDKKGYPSWDDEAGGMKIFFNHVVRLSSTPTQLVIEEAYRRGAALFLPGQFPGIDVLIPMKTGAGEIGAILVQVKNRRNDRLTSGLKNNFKADMKMAIQALDLQQHLPGGYLGFALCLRRSAGPEYEMFMTKPHTGHGTVSFPIVCALGLDIYQWRREGKIGDQMAELFDRILKSWPNMYPQSVLDDEYARKPIYPFLSINPNAN